MGCAQHHVAHAQLALVSASIWLFLHTMALVRAALEPDGPLTMLCPMLGASSEQV